MIWASTESTPYPSNSKEKRFTVNSWSATTLTSTSSGSTSSTSLEFPTMPELSKYSASPTFRTSGRSLGKQPSRPSPQSSPQSGSWGTHHPLHYPGRRHHLTPTPAPHWGPALVSLDNNKICKMGITNTAPCAFHLGRKRFAVRSWEDSIFCFAKLEKMALCCIRKCNSSLSGLPKILGSDTVVSFNLF